MLSLFLSGLVQADTTRILASIPPLKSLTEELVHGMPDYDVDVLLLKPVNPHHVSLRSSQARKIRKADLVLWVGPAFESWLMAAARSRPSLSMAVPGDRYPDTHLWLSSDMAGDFVVRLAGELGRQRPEDRDKLMLRARFIQRELATLPDVLRATAPDSRRPWASWHNATYYLQQDMGIQPDLVIAAHDHGHPGLRQSQQVRQWLGRYPNACLVVQDGFDSHVLADLQAQHPGLRVLAIDPLGFGHKTGLRQYAALLRRLAAQLNDCTRL
jgi:zinc transport system substrate-binding protein